MLSTEEIELQNRTWLFDYLKAHGPDLWHAMALDWNWDNEIWPMDWIVRQPECLAVTAQYIFWTTDPSYFLPTKGIDARRARINFSGEAFSLQQAILNNWREEFYSGAEVTFMKRLPNVQPKPISLQDSLRMKGSIVSYFPKKLEAAISYYREQEARCDISLLETSIPDSIYEIERVEQIGRCNQGLCEGIPDAYADYLEQQIQLNQASDS